MSRTRAPLAGLAGLVGLAGLIALLAMIAVLFAPSALASERDFVPNSVVVKFSDDATAAERTAARQAAGVIERLTGIRGTGGARLLSIAGGVRAAIARLESSGAVEYAEPNFIYRAQAIPNDPRFGELWGLQNTGQTGGTPGADIKAPAGWDAFGLAAFPASGGVKVGIVDTGIALNHQDLSGRTVDCGGVNNFGVSLIIVIIGSDPTIVDGKCSDDNGHGSHVAGTIAAHANNGAGVTGVAFNSPLAICKGLNSSGSGTLVMVANCIDWLSERDAKIISMSLGGGGSQALQSSVQNATANGALLVAAAGNSGNSQVSFPAGYPEVVSVAATDHNDQRASFSTFNSSVEMAAPGVNILSTWNNGGYNSISGTSMATPHVSGVAALIAGTNPGGGPSAWRAKLNTAVDDLGAPGRDPQFGFGRVNLVKAAP